MKITLIGWSSAGHIVRTINSDGTARLFTGIEGTQSSCVGMIIIYEKQDYWMAAAQNRKEMEEAYAQIWVHKHVCTRACVLTAAEAVPSCRLTGWPGWPFWRSAGETDSDCSQSVVAVSADPEYWPAKTTKMLLLLLINNDESVFFLFHFITYKRSFIHIHAYTNKYTHTSKL